MKSNVATKPSAEEISIVFVAPCAVEMYLFCTEEDVWI